MRILLDGVLSAPYAIDAFISQLLSLRGEEPGRIKPYRSRHTLTSSPKPPSTPHFIIFPISPLSKETKTTTSTHTHAKYGTPTLGRSNNQTTPHTPPPRYHRKLQRRNLHRNRRQHRVGLRNRKAPHPTQARKSNPSMPQHFRRRDGKAGD